MVREIVRSGRGGLPHRPGRGVRKITRRKNEILSKTIKRASGRANRCRIYGYWRSRWIWPVRKLGGRHCRFGDHVGVLGARAFNGAKKMKPTIKNGEWKDMLANLPNGRTILTGIFYKMEPESKIRLCFDMALETEPTIASGRPSRSIPGMSVAARKKITNRKWYLDNKEAKQAKRILRESQQTTCEGNPSSANA